MRSADRPRDDPIRRQGQLVGTAGSPRPRPLEWRRGSTSITAVCERTPLGTAHWSDAGSSVGLDLAVDLSTDQDPEVASELLDHALAELGGRGVARVRMTLTAGEPRTPGMLQIVRGLRPAALSAPFVIGAEVHAAGQSTLVDVALRATPSGRPDGVAG